MRVRGTTTSSLSLWRASLRVAVESIRRAAHRRSLCPASWATTTSMHPAHAMATSPARSSVVSEPSPSTSMSSMPPARVSMATPAERTASRVAASSISRHRGTTPAPMMAVTAAAAARTSVKSARAVATPGGLGTRRSVACVKTASVPSLPTRSDVTSYPVTPFTVRLPVRTTRPPMRYASRPSTQSRVAPYLKTRGPPAFSAMLPPIMQLASEFGSGA